MTINITPLIEVVITLIAALIARYIIPWVRSKTDAARLDETLQYVKMAVAAAEQIYRESGMGERKKQYVIDWLAERGFVLDTDELDAMIEAAVHDLNAALIGGGSK